MMLIHSSFSIIDQGMIMPIYNFKCEVCNRELEKSCGFHDDFSKITCPKGHMQTRRVFSPPAVIYKGSGFFVTDYSSKQSK
jgi:putative FmdB family regulatory protein